MKRRHPCEPLSRPCTSCNLFWQHVHATWRMHMRVLPGAGLAARPEYLLDLPGPAAHSDLRQLLHSCKPQVNARLTPSGVVTC